LKNKRITYLLTSEFSSDVPKVSDACCQRVGCLVATKTWCPDNFE